MKWWNMKQKNMSFLEYFQTVWNLQLSARHNATFLIILFAWGFCPFLLIFQINCKNAKLFLRKYFCINIIYFSRLVWIVHERLNCFLYNLIFCLKFHEMIKVLYQLKYTCIQKRTYRKFWLKNPIDRAV